MNNTKDFNPQFLKEEFIKTYGDAKDDIQIFASPARINIIGEHIDYNGGFVLPSAIDKYLYIAIRKREDSKITYNDVKFPGTYTFDINDNFEFKKENDYANYLNGILSIVKRHGYKFPVGFDTLICSNVPPAGGISSSSALECGFTFAVSELFGFGISRKDIALFGQQSEHEFMNVNCGIMDQYIIATAKENTAELIDCAAVSNEYIPLVLGDYRFVVMNTKKKRQLADSKYNERRSQCEEGLSQIKAASAPLSEPGKYSNTKNLPDLCSISINQLKDVESLIKDNVIKARVRHCITENNRVLLAADALKKQDLKEVGNILKQSHESLKTDYEVTGIELDTLADVANAEEGCIGARMTGAGFGGCAIAIVHKDFVEKFIASVQDKYTKIVGHDADFFSCSSSKGVYKI